MQQAPRSYKRKREEKQGRDLAETILKMTEERRASRCQKDSKKEAIGTIWRLYGKNKDNLDLDFILIACEMINTDENKRLI